MTKSLGPLFIVLLMGGLSFPLGRPHAAAYNTPASQLAAACASCHLPAGRGSGIPPIVGLTERRIVKMMFGYRATEPDSTHPSGSQIMYVVANSLSPQEITEVAHYLAGMQPAVKP